MKDPLDYQHPTTGGASAGPASARRTLGFGVVLFLAGVILLLGPLYLGKNLVGVSTGGFGFIAACCGLSCILHGAWDWWKI